jgi:hypothetical protein
MFFDDMPDEGVKTDGGAATDDKGSDDTEDNM